MLERKSVALLLSFLTIVLMASPVAAKEKPVQLSLFTPIQIFPDDVPIAGLRLNLIYVRSPYVTGLDWGLVNHTTSGLSQGIQWAAVGYNESDYTGWQASAANITKGNFTGFQMGVVNYANHAHGVQLGVVNYAITMNGLQVGLVNIIKQGGQFPVFPFVNWSF
jgi:energy-converting hydrogenase Eha subunit A